MIAFLGDIKETEVGVFLSKHTVVQLIHDSMHTQTIWYVSNVDDKINNMYKKQPMNALWHSAGKMTLNPVN